MSPEKKILHLTSSFCSGLIYGSDCVIPNVFYTHTHRHTHAHTCTHTDTHMHRHITYNK